MKTSLPALFIALALFSCSKTEQTPSKADGYIKQGRIDSLFSRSLNEQRPFYVYTPYGVENEAPKDIKYPVVYLLDGDTHFSSVSGLIQQLSQANGNTLCPEMIVVAIPNTDRTRDLTPSNDPNLEWAKTSGGADNFTKFIEELIPYIESHYPATNYRTLIGHSFGGLFVINALMHHRNLFDNYIAIDPSLWWHDRKLLDESMTKLDTGNFTGKSLYVGIAHTVKEGMSTEQVLKDTAQDSKHMKSIIEFCNKAKSDTKSGLTFESKYYPKDGHSNVVMISEYDAMRYLFDWYDTRDLNKYYYDDSKESASDVVDAIKSHYDKVSSRMRYKYLPREEDLRDLGYYFMRKKHHDRALAVINLNIENYPASIGVYDMLGDYYLDQKDSVKAADAFRKALTKGESKEVKEKLGKIGK